jgi:hypothetical protein
MNQAGQHPLGAFEQRLLGELRQVVAEITRVPDLPDQSAAAPPRRRDALRLALIGGAAAAIAIAVVSALSLGGGAESKAWAVNRNADGTVTVEIDSLSDAAGLERKLNEAGVPALVQYLPPGKTCAGADVAASEEAGSHIAGVSGRVTHGEGHSTGGHESDRGGAIAIRAQDDGGVAFTVAPAAHPGETLVIRSQGLARGAAPAGHSQGSLPAGTISVSHVEGVARPCKVADSP